eukprot:CAMPEP_0203674892 /NCGR_PEP_ID=MMETSP0090-20130426/17847_1 /ASSEMBLY_ACC=CAM_ASM_001088 /TAXON_ID=426623 /ORGANISM="Chaetoceros affinis, Strain CCMP159" /LENGTH=279 /DNA_ID=CAMNT_0050540889 /DNA_START=84 /DNA_END=923 /DNA_ORIENTATION=+
MTLSTRLVLVLAATILALQLEVANGAAAFTGAGKDALFKVTGHDEDVGLTRNVIMKHVKANDESSSVILDDDFFVEDVESFLVPATTTATATSMQIETATEIEQPREESPSSESNISREEARKILSSAAHLSSTFITSSRFIRAMPSLRGKIVKVIQKTNAATAAGVQSVKSATTATASTTLRLTHRGAKSAFVAAGVVVNWAVPTSLNLGDTSSSTSYRVTSTSAARRRASTGGSDVGSGNGNTRGFGNVRSILPLLQLGNFRTMNRIVQELVFVLQM